MEPRVDHWPWFAIHVRSKQGRIVSHTLRGQGYEEFLPFLKVTRTWSDRTKQLEEPLFPGYLFCRLNFEERLPVMKIPGVVLHRRIRQRAVSRLAAGGRSGSDGGALRVAAIALV